MTERRQDRRGGFLVRHTSTTLPLMLSFVALTLSIVAILTQAAPAPLGGDASPLDAEEWTNIPDSTLAGTGWRNLAPDRTSVVGYYRDAASRVHLKGQARDLFGRIPTESTLFVLPPGHRPARAVLLTGYLNGAVGRVTVLPEGNVVVHAPSERARLLSLDGLSFRADG